MPDSPTEWDYWCPPEGTHPFSSSVLFVGIVERRGEESWPLFVAAVVPPIPSEPPSQNESMAKVVRDALAAGDWTAQDGLVAWMRAHDGPTFAWPGAEVRDA